MALQALVHCWRKYTASSGDWVEKLCFVAANLPYGTVIVLFISVVVSMEVNSRHYFQSDLRVSLYGTHSHPGVPTVISNVLKIAARALLCVSEVHREVRPQIPAGILLSCLNNNFPYTI